MSLIKSVYDTNTQILESISTLYLENDGFDLDPTYSKGNFYKTFPEPKFKSDLIPKFDDVVECDCRSLWFNDSELSSICFDPPFLFRTSKTVNNDKMCKRFSYFNSRKELLNMYSESLKEFKRILKKNGIIAIKCQDASEWGKNYFTHIDVFLMAKEIGFDVLDIFILTANNRIYRGDLKQRMAKKFHSYWYVLKKK